MPAKDLPILEFPDRGVWERWLDANHASSGGVRLKIAKKGSGATTVTYPEALEEAIRYGWIDGQKGAHDGAFWLQCFGPRGPRSKWSQINRRKDFREALDANPAAREFFATLKSSERYSFLYRIYDAKRAETRARRIRQYVAMLADRRRFHG